MLDFVNKAKWDSWKSLGTLPQVSMLFLVNVLYLGVHYLFESLHLNSALLGLHALGLKKQNNPAELHGRHIPPGATWIVNVIRVVKGSSLKQQKNDVYSLGFHLIWFQLKWICTKCFFFLKLCVGRQYFFFLKAFPLQPCTPWIEIKGHRKMYYFKHLLFSGLENPWMDACRSSFKFSCIHANAHALSSCQGVLQKCHAKHLGDCQNLIYKGSRLW